MIYPITGATQSDYEELTALWEASVRATHHFLSEDDILTLRTLVRTRYLPAIPLYVCRSSHGEVLGFMGCADGCLEMLFIAPEQRGNGVGTALLTYATKTLGVYLLEVNEQNPHARDFYLRRGFDVTGRSECDGEGRPFPLLHMRLRQEAEGDET